MLKVGLTGGVACGKSTVGQMFVSRGAHLVQADRIAHGLMLPGTPEYQEILRRFGRRVLQPDGAIDRRKLADAAFGTGRIAELNAIVHPAVIREQERWMDELGASVPGAVAIVEAALILEAGVGSHFDKLIAVTCSPEQKVQRFAARHQLDFDTARREVERRSAAQWSDAEKARASDYVIDNSGPLDATQAQVERVWTELQKSLGIRT